MAYNLKLPKSREIEMRASFWKRILAFIIDLAAINLIIITPFENSLKGLPAMESFGDSYNYLMNNPSIVSHYTSIFFAISLLSLLYFTLLEWKFGQTIGKMFMKIYVQPNGITFFKALVRNLFIIPFFPFILLWVIDPILIITSKDGQRLEEKLTSTMVVESHII